MKTKQKGAVEIFIGPEPERWKTMGAKDIVDEIVNGIIDRSQPEAIAQTSKFRVESRKIKQQEKD